MQADHGSALADSHGDNAVFIRTDVCIEDLSKVDMVYHADQT